MSWPAHAATMPGASRWAARHAAAYDVVRDGCHGHTAGTPCVWRCTRRGGAHASGVTR